MSNPIRLSIDVSPELNHLLDEMAEKTHSSKSDLLVKSIALMRVAVQEIENGNYLGILNKEEKLLKQIVGI